MPEKLSGGRQETGVYEISDQGDLVLVSKSTMPFCGTENDCLLSCLLLNFGNPFLSLKNFVNDLSKFSKLA